MKNILFYWASFTKYVKLEVENVEESSGVTHRHMWMRKGVKTAAVA